MNIESSLKLPYNYPSPQTSSSANTIIIIIINIQQEHQFFNRTWIEENRSIHDTTQNGSETEFFPV